MTDLLARLKDVARSGGGLDARCPAHADEHNSLSIDHRDGRWLINCHAGCAFRRSSMQLGSRLPSCLTRTTGQGARSSPSTTAQPRNRTRSLIEPDLHLEPEQSTAGEQRHRADP